MALGGKREGSGRKPKATEIAVIEAMDKAIAPQSAWEALAGLVESGDVAAIKLYLNYRYGMPKQVMDVKHEGDISLNFVKSAGCQPLPDE